MALGIGLLVGQIVSAATKILTLGLAVKGLLLTLVVLVLPSVLYNLYGLIISETLDYASSVAGEVTSESVTIQLVGVGAWLADHLKIPESVSFILSCAAGRFVLSLIRGI